MDTEVVDTEAVKVQVEHESGGTLMSWPTTEQFMAEATRDDAVSIAAVEILEIQAGIVQAINRINTSPMPDAIRAIFCKKLRTAVGQLYAAFPNQVVPQIEHTVLVEQCGGPEKFEELRKHFEAEEAKLKERAAKADDGGVVSVASTSDSKPESEGASPSAPALTLVPNNEG